MVAVEEGVEEEDSEEDEEGEVEVKNSQIQSSVSKYSSESITVPCD